MSGWWHDGTEVDFDKELDSDIEVDIDFDTNIEFTKYVNVDIEVDSSVNIEGNLTSVTFDAEAFGYDTLVEVDIAVLTLENELSSAAGSIIVAA